MSPYIFTFGALLFAVIFDFSDKKIIRLYGMFFSFVILLVLVGLRDETGTDWEAYSEHYSLLLKGEDTSIYSYGIGYEFIAWFSAGIGFSYNNFVFFYTLIYLTIFFSSFSKLKHQNLAVFLFYALYLVGFMGTSRQMMSFAIVSLGFFDLRERNIKTFIMRVLIASLFHMSSLIIMLGLFVRYKHYVNLTSIAIFTFLVAIAIVNKELFFIALFKTLSYSDLLSMKMSAYQSDQDHTPIFYVDDGLHLFYMYAKRFFIALLLWGLHKSSPNNSSVFLSAHLYIIGMVVFFTLHDILPAVAVRLAIYFTFFEIFAFSSIKIHNAKNIAVVLFAILLAAYTLFSVLEGVDRKWLVPYKGYGYIYQYLFF